MARNFAELEWLCPISTMVKHLTHILKVDGSNPTTGTEREKMARHFMELKWLCPASSVVEHFTHNPTVGGSKPTAGTGKEKMAKTVFELNDISIPYKRSQISMICGKSYKSFLQQNAHFDIIS
jgi:hypothetical protein